MEWYARGPTPGGKAIMEGQLMDQWTNAFAKQFYDQLKAEQRRKAALLKKIKIAAITIGVICLTIIIL